METDTIYNMDCLEGMKLIPDGSIDAIICDLPYGTMKGSGKWEKMGWEGDQHDWDEIIPTDQLFEQYQRVLRRGGACVLFSQEPYTSHLRTYKAKNMDFLYPMIWEKDSAGLALNAKNAPLFFYEDINVFRKSNPIVRDMNSPLRDYSRKILAYIGKTGGQITKELIAMGIEAPYSYRNFLSPDAEWMFNICLESQYNKMMELYDIDKMEGFLPYAECKRLWDESNLGHLGENIYNLPEGKSFKSNILKYGKDTDGFHPTQKPVALIADLIRTYSNEGDTILDNCMGSGTTAVACIKEKRHYIGFELNKDYFDKACRRIDAEKRQLSLF